MMSSASCRAPNSRGRSTNDRMDASTSTRRRDPLGPGWTARAPRPTLRQIACRIARRKVTETQVRQETSHHPGCSTLSPRSTAIVRAMPGGFPEGTSVAVSLSFDDARPSQLEGVRILDDHGIRATFYVLPKGLTADR